MTGSPPLGPGYTTGTKHQLVDGHGPSPALSSYPTELPPRHRSIQFTGGRGRPRRHGGYTGSGPRSFPSEDGFLAFPSKGIENQRPRNLSVPRTGQANRRARSWQGDARLPGAFPRNRDAATSARFICCGCSFAWNKTIERCDGMANRDTMPQAKIGCPIRLLGATECGTRFGSTAPPYPAASGMNRLQGIAAG